MCSQIDDNMSRMQATAISNPKKPPAAETYRLAIWMETTAYHQRNRPRANHYAHVNGHEHIHGSNACASQAMREYQSLPSADEKPPKWPQLINRQPDGSIRLLRLPPNNDYIRVNCAIFLICVSIDLGYRCFIHCLSCFDCCVAIVKTTLILKH